MKKSLVALAALAATGAFAQSAVTLSGGVSMGVRSAQSFTSTTGALNVTSNGNAKGLHTAVAGVNNDSANMLQATVVEDLGGGMKATGVAQLRLNEGSATVGATQMALAGTGDMYVQLDGGFGSFRAGQWSVASHAGWNAFGSRTISGVFTSVNNVGGTGNTVGYTTPTVGGFSASAAYSFNPTVEAGADGGLLMVNYSAGPVAARLQYAANNSNNATRPNGYGLAASYDLGVAKIFATTMSGKATVGSAGTTVIDRTGYSLSAQVPLGAATLRAGVLNHGKDTTANVLDRRSFGADYALSKRTTLIADFAMQKQAVTGANKVNTYFVGVAHTF